MPVSRNTDQSITPVTADAATTASFYYGYNFRNSTGAAIVVAVYDGTSTAGVLIDSIALAAGESDTQMYVHPIDLTSGSVFVDWTTGIVGSVRVIV